MNGTLMSGASDESSNDFAWLQVESLRLMEEHADPEHGICGNEWRIIEELRSAEEAGRVLEILRALRGCACPHLADMANAMLAAA